MRFLDRQVCRSVIRAAVVCGCFASVLMAQEVGVKATVASNGSAFPQAPQKKGRYGVETSVSVGAFGQLTATRISESQSSFMTESLSPSAGALGTFQQRWKPWLGYSVNFGYTRANYRYAAATSASENEIGITHVPNNVYETSVSYIAQKHMTSRLTAFGEAGAGAIGFAAITRAIDYSRGNLYVGRSNTFRPVGIAGFGVDYRLSHGLGVRAQYRGLFVQYPDYGSGRSGLTTLMSEPTVSVTYTFGRR